MKYTCSFQVRGYELDSFGHVNNAVYLNYYEHARWLIMEELGLLEYFKNSGGFLVVIRADLKFIKELQLLEEVTVHTTYKTEGFFVVFKQEIRNNHNERINTATIKCLLVNSEKEAVDVPDVLKNNISSENPKDRE
jgi:YbgC/YbaW family acyl-CoA thioester hydrolase